MKIGAHVSTAKPFSESIARAGSIGCECMQIFTNPPQRWNPAVLDESEISKFLLENQKAKINPILIHGIYLINLASDNPFFYDASIASLVDDMAKADRIGAIGVNFHIGSTKGKSFSDVLPKVADAIKTILKKSPLSPYLILENSAGAGNIIGDTLEELSQVIEAVQSDRIKVLIDTAHAFASGYNLKTADDLDNFILKIDRTVGLNRLVGFHFNDSKSEFNSKKDRHADIGCGEIGSNIFKEILNHKSFHDLFAIIETPADNKNFADQIQLLKSMRSS